jgi:hypothetical protein
MVDINYQKRKNIELFKSLEDSSSLFLSDAQNYIPIYNKFFALNETNYNGINLNNKWNISSVIEKIENNSNFYNCKVKNIHNNKIKNKELFFKLAPLLDPYKYLIGKYNVNDSQLFTLPKINSNETNCNSKFIDENNSAYVDGMFLYLTSKLNENFHFQHGVEYFGSFLGIKNNFTINVFDDIDYLNNSDFFNKNKNTLFKIDSYEHLFQNENKLKPIIINHNLTANSQLSIESINNSLFEDVFEDKENKTNTNTNNSKNINISNSLEDITNNNLHNTISGQVTLKTNSTCSSRSSYTNNNDDEFECDDDETNSDITNEYNSDSEIISEEEEEEEIINVTIPKFPVQVICMEYCENTFDNLILNNELSQEEWYSTFMQIIMILITYQKAFNFTHNDLHTNNVMYNTTEKKYIYYYYKKKYYKVPTFGRIFKIIDFGRSIYKFEGKLFCSDSFQIGGDAATQYNTEPYLNQSKPRLEPNYSFDLCRLACSIFDYLIDDIEEIKDLSKCKDPIKKLIVEWCLDDKGVNMLYKNNGADRYPEFKLYKMIARCVHNHTPQAQLERPEFKQYLYNGLETTMNNIIDIDNIPVCI